MDPTYVIGVSQKMFDQMSKDLGKKKQFIIQFAGDDFKTRLWRKDGVLMGSDHRYPDGREIKVCGDEEIRKANMISIKGAVIQFLINRGYTIDVAMDAVTRLKVSLDCIHYRLEQMEDNEERYQESIAATRRACVMALAHVNGSFPWD
jgi:hypothetical protein